VAFLHQYMQTTKTRYTLKICSSILTDAYRHIYYIRECIQKFPDWVDNEINNKNNNKLSLRSNTKGYGGKTHYTDSQNGDTTAPSGKELYHLQFSLQAASPETSGYTFVCLEFYR
jgi:hypothetical protein